MTEADPHTPPAAHAADQRRLRDHQRRLRWRAGGSVLLLAAAVGPWLTPILGSAFYLRGPGLLLLGLAVVWSWWHRHLPTQLWAVRRDLLAARTPDIEGVATVLQTRAPGVFAPSRPVLLVGARQFSTEGWTPAQLAPGQRVCARYAQFSGLLLEVRVLASPATAPAAVTTDPAQPVLTPTEHRLLQLLAQGLDDKRIARALELAPSTVRTYNATLFRKLGVRRRTEAVQRALDLGLTLSIDTD